MSVTVTLADGSARESSRTWGDGTSDCPWCEYPMIGGSCGNPVCDVQLDAERLAARRAEQERRAAADAAAQRLTDWIVEDRAVHQVPAQLLLAEQPREVHPPPRPGQLPEPRKENTMTSQKYSVDLMASVYITVDVEAASYSEAVEKATSGLPRYPVAVTKADPVSGAPNPIDPDDIHVSKDWEVTGVRDAEGDEVWE